jgi:hypothetical protein
MIVLYNFLNKLSAFESIFEPAKVSNLIHIALPLTPGVKTDDSNLSKP